MLKTCQNVKLFPPEITKVSKQIYSAADLRVAQLLDMQPLYSRYYISLNRTGDKPKR